jgi:cytochrome P450
MVVATAEEALAAWGAYDQDDPFPAFAGVRELGTVHLVTLTDGHSAWLVSGHEEARAAPKDPRLSKDAVPATELHWGHGDGLVLRGLSELPVIPGPAQN